MYNVYLIFIWALYESMPDYIPIHHVMHVEYGNKVLLLLLLLFQCVVVVSASPDWQRDVRHCRSGNNNSTCTCTRSRGRCSPPDHHTECSAISRHPLQLLQTIITNYIAIYYRVTVVVHFIRFVEQNKRLSTKTLLS